jgi:chorismate-pyruvate lyase
VSSPFKIDSNSVVKRGGEMEIKDNKVIDFIPLLEDRLSNLLLQMDGSTTRMLTALVGGALTVDLKLQEIIQYNDLPVDIQSNFSGEGPFLHRVSSLKYQEDCLSDNAVFADINLLPPELRENISQGKSPLGLLIANMEYRRQYLEGNRMKLDALQHLFTPVDLPSGESLIKKYLIIQDQRCWFYICETFQLEKLLKCFLAG